MKRFLLFSILLSISLACHKDTSIGPDDLLFQRWQLVQSKRIGDTAWLVYDTGARYDTEYRQDGSLVYRRDNIIQSVNCCRATRFRRSDKEIAYTETVSCPYALCAATASVFVIQRLTTDLLELNDGTYIMQYGSIR